MMKKGYVLIVLFALFVSVVGTLKYKLSINRDLEVLTLSEIIFRIIVGFLLYLFPGLLLVRWYYNMKDNKK
ncbi:MAG: hypothetical protein EOP48_23680 [Sphingobacteriales bacterium]|nr:MAG: hypothetical protein EOP48_23680 [Sphingobacteriales bacterium]